VHYEKNGKVQDVVDLGNIERLISAKTVEEKETIWQKLKTTTDFSELIHSPATMKFLNSCVRGLLSKISMYNLNILLSKHVNPCLAGRQHKQLNLILTS